MVKKRLIADSIGFLSLLLGVVGGAIATWAAYDMNPQGEFNQYPSRLVIIFLSWMSCVAFPTLFIRHVLCYRNPRLFWGLFMSGLVGGGIGFVFAERDPYKAAYIIFAFGYMLSHQGKKAAHLWIPACAGMTNSFKNHR